MKLNNILKDLILEIASRDDDIKRAIDDKKVISIFYDGDDPGEIGRAHV